MEKDGWEQANIAPWRSDVSFRAMRNVLCHALPQVVWSGYLKTMRAGGFNSSTRLYAASGMLTYGASGGHMGMALGAWNACACCCVPVLHHRLHADVRGIRWALGSRTVLPVVVPVLHHRLHGDVQGIRWAVTTLPLRT